MTHKLTLSVSETQDLTGICRTNLYKLMNKGELLSKKLGNRRLILRSDLEEFLSNLEASPVKNGGTHG